MDTGPFNFERESQDDYCRGCVHADSCNVMLKDGEECGDRYVPAGPGLTMTQTIYTRTQLDWEARRAVTTFKRTLPAALRQSVKYDGWILRVGENIALVAQFQDANGPHDINIAI